jgi:RNA polymerase sigma-70 factor (ECF subfamily)
MKSEEFESRVAPHRAALERFVAMMVMSETEDIVQEAIATAFREIEKFEQRSKFSTWLYGIALNLCRKHLRDCRRHAISMEQGWLEAQAGRNHAVFSSVIRLEMAEKLALSVAHLPTSMREAFLLRYVDGMDYPEISVITGVSMGTARIRAFRARALLREELGTAVDTAWLEKD